MYFFIFVVIQGGLSFFTVMYLFGIVLFAASKIVFVIVLVMISMSSFLKIPSQSTTERRFL